MSSSLGSLLNDVLTIAGGIFLISIYFNKNGKLYRKRWVAIVAVLIITKGAIDLVHNYGKYFSSKIPARGRLIKEISQDDKALEKDILFESEYGFRIRIPRGYSYKVYNEGLQLLAFSKRRDSDFLAGIISVGKTETIDDLKIAVDKGMEYLVSKNSTYRFYDREIFGKPGWEGIKMNVFVVKNGEPMKVIMAFIKKPGWEYLYELTLGCHEKFWEENKKLFEETLATFSLD